MTIFMLAINKNMYEEWDMNVKLCDDGVTTTSRLAYCVQIRQTLRQDLRCWQLHHHCRETCLSAMPKRRERVKKWSIERIWKCMRLNVYEGEASLKNLWRIQAKLETVLECKSFPPPTNIQTFCKLENVTTPTQLKEFSEYNGK